jgi:hypothetical protein
MLTGLRKRVEYPATASAAPVSLSIFAMVVFKMRLTRSIQDPKKFLQMVLHESIK